MDDLRVNVTGDYSTNTTSTYDAEGAMKFTVAVVTMYSAGMVGVLILGFLNGRKQYSTMDEQANFFIKDIEKVRVSLEKKERLHSVNKMLDTMSINNKAKNTSIVGTGLLPFMALPVFFGQQITEPEEKLTRADSSNEETTDDETENVPKSPQKVTFYLGKDESPIKNECGAINSKNDSVSNEEIVINGSSIEMSKNSLNHNGNAENIREKLCDTLQKMEEENSKEATENDFLLNNDSSHLLTVQGFQ